ncbi:hypothetical protein ARALYDRAFT_492758 [Arabidopsis lyrata subsp. lyrata]|uniref:F-box associated beta-propeller type 3 domain-containing protein n=1 Tax=Arabidopsis lyrata subsp. lyrata TaxID=81972 RepID=D7MEV6_ARALL|nr:hypothetical protein ARALYDRAFT_492758 [Arabidopsis lyrata subsp. lyrata]
MDRREEEETESEEDESRIGKIFELIPLDLTPDILLRLPAKSAVRFRVASKLRSSITTRPDFIRSFAFHSSTRLCLMACVKARDKRLFISLRHGLVCFGDFYKIVVWNPSMRQHVTLPEPKPRVMYFIRSCLGHDPVEDKYKVLSISGYHKGHHDPLVFTLGPQESWRVVQNSPLHIPLPTMGRVGICINGHVYYEAEIRFKVDDTFEFERILMLNYHGKLAWFCYGFSSIRFWVLVDGDKQEWSLINFVLPFPTFPQSDPIFECSLELTGVTHDTGEFIFIYYDPKRERERRIEYEGIGNKEFWIHNGILDNNRGLTIDWFPNHNESLMSLVNVLIKAD